MADLDAGQFQRVDAVRQCLIDEISLHGYRQVDTPIVEPTELFLRKSGGERVAQMYAFRYRERDIALRPEHTASILRMYVDSMQSQALPLRLSYAGPVFRYEKPQASRTRQFTEVGCELLGASGPLADAEVIHLALDGLASVGVHGRLVLGHVGLVLEYLERLPLRHRARDWLLWSMERLRKGRSVDLETEITGLTSGDRLADLFDQMSGALGQVPSEQLESWVLAVLNEVGVQTEGGSRTPEEIVAGVVDKMNRHSDEGHVRQAFTFVEQLAGLRGSPDHVLPELRALVRAHDLNEEPIQRIEQVLEILSVYGHDTSEIELSPGLGRGLHYYTGMLFEIYEDESQQVQLCGGGRYDDLAQTLGSRQPLDASGFTYGLERIAEVAKMADEKHTSRILVVPIDDNAHGPAIRVAEHMRDSGDVVELDVRGRSVASSRRFAQRNGIAALVVVDADGKTAIERFDEAAGTESLRTTNDD